MDPPGESISNRRCNLSRVISDEERGDGNGIDRRGASQLPPKRLAAQTRSEIEHRGLDRKACGRNEDWAG